MKFLITLLFLIILIFSCQKAHQLTPEEKEIVRMDVETLLTDNFINIKEEGFQAELLSLDNSPDFYWVPPRKSNPISYDSIASILRKFTPRYKLVESEWDSIHIQPLTREIASYTGRYHSVYIDTTNFVSNFSMVETGVAMKINGKWKLVSGQTSITTGK